MNINGTWRDAYNSKRIYITGAETNGIINPSKIKTPITIINARSVEIYGWYELIGYNNYNEAITTITSNLGKSWAQAGCAITINDIDQSGTEWDLSKDSPIRFYALEKMTICGNYNRNSSSQYINGCLCAYSVVYYLIKVICN